MAYQLKSMVSRQKEKDGFDNFPTPPKVTRALFEYGYEFSEGSILWDSAAGQGHMVKVFQEYGFEAVGSDINIYPNKIPDIPIIQMDMFKPKPEYKNECDWIITNPPNFCSMEFTLAALDFAKRGVCIMTRLLWCETKSRYQNIFKDGRPNKVIVFPERIGMIEGELVEKIASGICFAWYVFDKEKMTGDHICELDWFPPDISHLIREGDYETFGEWVNPAPKQEQLTMEF